MTGFCATWNISQIGFGHVMLEVVRRQKLDPKHVRWFFYRRSLFVQIFVLLTDGIWWLISRGFGRVLSRFGNALSVFLPTRFPVNEKTRRLHSFIVGRTGTGKSVLMHHLIRHYLTKNRKPTIILLDPHGDLARSVARDRMNWKYDRLVHIRFDRLVGHYAHFNPFELKNTSEQNLNHAQLQFAGAVEQIIGENFTPRQRTLIRACLGVMLHRANSTLIDLVRLLQDGQNADLVRYGQTQLPNIVDRQFFTGSFHDPLYRASKLALVSRLTDIIRDPIVRRFTCAQNSFDLGEILDSGKVLVVQFDPSKQGRHSIRTIGQLLNAAILSHVLGRPTNKRHPIHLFVDEAYYFVSPTISEILGESRKFGLYVTLAAQRTEQLNPALQAAILGNVGTIWAGGSRHVTAKTIAKETDIAADTIRALPNLQFLPVVGSKSQGRQKLRFIGNRYAMPAKQWRRIQQAQAERFYRKPTNIDYPKFNDQTNAGWTPEQL